MKKTLFSIIFLTILLVGLSAMSFQAGLTYTQPASLDNIIGGMKEKNLSVLLAGHEVCVSGHMTDSFLDVGIDAGVALHESASWVPVPLFRAYVGMKVRLFEYFGIGGHVGGQIKLLSDNSFDASLFWRFAGEIMIEPINIELYMALPVPLDQGLASVFNFGTAAHNARFGLAVTYEFI